MGYDAIWELLCDLDIDPACVVLLIEEVPCLFGCSELLGMNESVTTLGMKYL
jgi:hypothetical protein